MLGSSWYQSMTSARCFKFNPSRYLHDVLIQLQVLTVSLGLPNMESEEINFSNPKYAWPAAYVTSVSPLANVAVFLTSLDCNMEQFHLTYCQHNDRDSCSVRLIASHTETYIRYLVNISMLCLLQKKIFMLLGG